ncbi:RNA-splicing factor [Massospora cicadina]|nr:RNA-splicing factor [Massospora cicadina]
MYNGIGLATARGSGTNGYVVKNLSVITRHPRPQTYTAEVQDQPDLLPYRKPDEGILLHEKKRQIEVQCLELQLQLEDQGLADEETMMQVDKLRVKLFRALEEGKEQKPIKVLKPSDTHQLAHAKKFENTKMMRALGISESNYVEGAAFDRERKLREKMLRENEIELEKARMLQNAKLNQGLGSDSDSSETDSKRKRHHKKSKSKRKEKRRQESPLTQTRSFKEIASQTQPFVHPSRRHLQPNSPDKNLEATRHSRDLGLDGHSHKHSDVHQNDRSLGYSGRSPSHRFKSQFCELNSGNKAKGSSSRSSSRDRAVDHEVVPVVPLSGPFLGHLFAKAVTVEVFVLPFVAGTGDDAPVDDPFPARLLTPIHGVGPVASPFLVLPYALNLEIVGPKTLRQTFCFPFFKLFQFEITKTLSCKIKFI